MRACRDYLATRLKKASIGGGPVQFHKQLDCGFLPILSQWQAATVKGTYLQQGTDHEMFNKVGHRDENLNQTLGISDTFGARLGRGDGSSLESSEGERIE